MPHTFPMIAKTLPGLEPILEQELLSLGAQEVACGRRMVSYRGDLALLYRSNICLRTALKILRPIYEFDAEDIELLYAALARYDWGQWLTPESTFAVDSVVYSSTFTHSRYVTYRTKDAIVDYFTSRADSGRRPMVKLSNPQYIFHVHIAEQHVTLSLDSSGESLHKRGYRLEQDRAPINEVLAAGILLKAGWSGQCDLMDPFCGSGTFLIEAALIATGTPPGIYRESYPFERWKDFDANLFSDIYNDDSMDRPFSHRIWGADISRQALDKARRNIQRSGLSQYITLEERDFAEQTLPTSANKEQVPSCIVVMNPPYGDRLSDFDLEKLYKMIGSTLKHHFTSAQAWIIAHGSEHFHAIGLKPNSREKLYNGSLECELRGYTLFAGKHKEYKEALNLAAETSKGDELTTKMSLDRESAKRQRRPHPHRALDRKTNPRAKREKQLFGNKSDRARHNVSNGKAITENKYPSAHPQRDTKQDISTPRRKGGGHRAKSNRKSWNIQTFGSDDTFIPSSGQ